MSETLDSSETVKDKACVYQNKYIINQQLPENVMSETLTVALQPWLPHKSSSEIRHLPSHDSEFLPAQLLHCLLSPPSVQEGLVNG